MFRWCLAALLLASSTLLIAQQTGSRAPAPQFRTGVDAVVIDLRVVDADGNFVRGLTRDDFQIFEDGQEQSIATLDLVDLPINKPGPVTTDSPIEPDVSNNDVSTEGRVYVLVLDDMHGPSGDARGSDDFVAPVRTFIEQYMADGDLAALITTSGRKDLTVSFTESRQRLLEVLDRFTLGYGPEFYSWLGREWSGSPGRAMTGRATTPGARAPADTLAAGRRENTRTGFVRDDRTTTTVSLRALARWLEGVSSRRKAIVLFQGGDVLRTVVRGECGLTLSRGNEALWGQEREETRTVIEAAGRGNVAVFALVPVLAGGLMRSRFPVSWDLDWAFTSAPSPTLDRGRADPSLCQQGLGAIARDTGGFVSLSTPAAFERVVSENSSYYMLGYSPVDKTEDDRFRRVEVRVNQPGLHVMARSGYVNKSSVVVRGRTPPDMLPGLAEVLQSPLPVPNLTLAVAAPAFRGAGSQHAVNVVVEADVQKLFFDPADGQPNTETLLTEIVAADVDGTVKAGRSGSLTMASPVPANLELIRQHGARFLHQLTLKPGRYHLRIAAYGRDSDRGGSVHREIVVPDFSKGALTMSDVAIALSSAAQPFTGEPGESWTPGFDTVPTARRAFSQDNELIVYAEVYDNTRAPGQPVTVETAVYSETGDRVFAHTQSATSTGNTTRFRVHRLTTQIPLTEFPPGSYVIEVHAQGRAPSHRVARLVPFRIE